MFQWHHCEVVKKNRSCPYRPRITTASLAQLRTNFTFIAERPPHQPGRTLHMATLWAEWNSAVLSPKFGCRRWFSKTSINHVCVAIKFTCNLHINVCCVCDLVYIYIYMFLQSEYFRIILSILELNPFGVVEQKWKMSKHFILDTFGLPVWIPESWTMLNQKVGPGHYICHYMSLRIFVPEMKHDGNYCRYHPVKVKRC